MSLKDWYRSVKEVASDIKFWVGFGILVGGLISAFLIWGQGGFFDFIRENIQILWIAALSAIMLALFMWTWRLYKRLLGGYRDEFRNLDGWDYKGEGWRLKKGSLVVKGSHGFTKVGTQWENYTLSFSAKIINICLGVIVRASDPNNFYMFQIQADKVRPHRRVVVPIIVQDNNSTDIEEESNEQFIIRETFEWHMDRNNPEFKSIPISPTLDDWFDVTIIVKGQSLQMLIDDKFDHEWVSLLQIPTGKVGFRNAHDEEAQIRDLRIILHH